MKKICRFQSACLFCSIAVFLAFGGGHSLAQTVLDLSTIEPDVKILGSGNSSLTSRAVVLDFDDSGENDIFFFDYDYQEKYGTECVFGYLNFSSEHPEPHIDLADGGHDLIIVGDPAINYRLGLPMAVGDWNNDGVDDLAVSDIFADMDGVYNGGVVYVFWGGERWQDGGMINLAIVQADMTIYSSNLAENPEIGFDLLALDINNDGIDEILTVPGPHPDNPARLKSWNFDGGELTQIERKSFMVFEEGPYVAGARLAFGNFYQDPPFLP